MANLLKIKDILKDKKYSIRQFALDLNMSEQGLQKLIRENSTKVETLEKIAKKLNVSISTFFEDECPVNTPTLEIDINERLLSIIESQQRTIENLTKK